MTPISGMIELHGPTRGCGAEGGVGLNEAREDGLVDLGICVTSRFFLSAPQSPFLMDLRILGALDEPKPSLWHLQAPS